jgi:hypothetical protein
MWQPVIGSSFDADAAQQYQWANHNAAVESANLQRQAEAQRQQQQYNWQARQEAERQQENDLQMQRADEAQNFARTQNAAQEQRRQYEWKNSFDAQKQQIQDKKDEFNQRLDLEKKQLDKTEGVVKDVGANLSPALTEAGNEHEAMISEYQDADADFRKAQSAATQKIQKLGIPNVFINRETHLFDSKSPIPKEKQEDFDSANQLLSDAKLKLDIAATKSSAATQKFEVLKSNGGQYRLLPVKVADSWVFHSPDLGKTFDSHIDSRDAELYKRVGSSAAEINAAQRPASIPGVTPVAPPSETTAPASTPSGVATAPSASAMPLPFPSPDKAIHGQAYRMPVTGKIKFYDSTKHGFVDNPPSNEPSPHSIGYDF